MAKYSQHKKKEKQIKADNRQPLTPKNSLEKKRSISFLESRYILPLILLLTFIVFFSSISNDFVLNWDDENYIMKNPYIQDVSFNMIKNVFTTFYKGNYFPVTSLCYAIEFHFFGANPKPYHIINLLIHIIGVAVVFIFTKKLFRRTDAAIIVALLFGIHPMQVESVAWIAELKNVLYGLFYMLSLLYYLKHIENTNKYKYLIFSFLFFLLSDLSKSAATTIPIILFLIDFYYRRKLTYKTIIEKIPFFIVAAIIGIAAIFAQMEAHALRDISSVFSKFDIFLLSSYQTLVYLIKLFVPINLCAFYYYPVSSSAMSWEFYVSPVILILIAFGAYKLKTLKREIIFSLLFFLIGISIMLQFIAFSGVLVAERFVYTPYIGLFFIIAQVFCYYKDKIFKSSIPYKPMLIVVYCSFILFLCITTINRIPVWKNAVVLFTDVIEKNPGGDFGYQYRGVAKGLSGDFKGCIEDQNKAIEINPKYPEAYYSRGLAKMTLKDMKGAFDDFQKATELIKEYPDAYNNMGNIMLKYKQFDKALSYYDLVIQYNPKHSLAFYNKGACYYYMKDMGKACEFWEKASALGYQKAEEMRSKFCK